MAKPKKKRPSIKDVARLAGVSQTTVSFVINKSDVSIPPETRDRVLAAVNELGYRPNIIARGLRSNRTYTIGFISDEIVTTPYATRIIQGAQDQAWKNGYIILMIGTGGNPDMKEAALHAVYDRKVDGIVYATMYHRQIEAHEMMQELPTVLLDCTIADHSLPSVVPDEVTGGRVATEFLLQKGHRRIGLINNKKPVPAKFGRLEGYRQALSNYSVPFDQNLVYEGLDGIPEGGYDGAKFFLQQEIPPTAFFCFNDRMAMGAYDAIRKKGLSIPDDIAVVGYDNQELIAADIVPGLTTMELPHYEMGQWAVRHLLELIVNPEKMQSQQPIQKVLECPIIVRDSA